LVSTVERGGGDQRKAGHFSNEQTVAMLPEATRGEKPVATLYMATPCQEKGICAATFFTWRRKFGALNSKEVQCLRGLEKENVRFKKLLAERGLEIACLSAIITSASSETSRNWAQFRSTSWRIRYTGPMTLRIRSIYFAETRNVAPLLRCDYATAIA
jgi:putative transposase